MFNPYCFFGGLRTYPTFLMRKLLLVILLITSKILMLGQNRGKMIDLDEDFGTGRDNPIIPLIVIIGIGLYFLGCKIKGDRDRNKKK